MPISSTSNSELAASPVTPTPAPDQPAIRGVGRLLAFFLVLGLAAAGVHQLINFGLRQVPTSSFGVLNKIMDGNVNAEILISGSSRALDHYDPRVIEAATGLKTFNIGLNGSQTDMQLALLKTYLKHNTKPRLVIQNLDMFSLITSHNEVYDPGQYIPYLNEPAIYQALQKIDPEVWKWKYLPLYGYTVNDLRFTWMIGAAALFGHYPKEDHYQGFRPSSQRWTGEFERFKASNPHGVRFGIEPQGESDLEELIAICRRQGIAVLLVYSPVYSEMQLLEQNAAEVFAEFEALSQKWQAPLWDYRKSPIGLRQELFYNSQHLNQEGAALFSKDLAARLAVERPWENTGTIGN